MTILKNLIIVSLIFLVNNCSLNNFQNPYNKSNYYVDIESSGDKYNTIYKENLKRLFLNNNNDASRKFILKTKITFQSSETLSVGGQNILKSTKANISYELKNKNVILESGSINTFPALSSSSSSLYSQEKSIEHIRERLIKSAAKSLYMRINLIIRRLS